MIFPDQPATYQRQVEVERNRVLVQADLRNVKLGADINLQAVGTKRTRLILQAPNGTRWQVLVSNLGALSATSVP